MLGTHKFTPLHIKIAIFTFFLWFVGIAIIYGIAGIVYSVLERFVWTEMVILYFFLSFLLYICWFLWTHAFKYEWLQATAISYANKGEYVKAKLLLEKKLSGTKNVQQIYAFQLKSPYILRRNQAQFEQCFYYQVKMLLEVNKKNYSVALKFVDNMLKVWPNNAFTWYNKACIECLNDEKKHAIKSLMRAIELSPRYLQHARKDKDLTPIWDSDIFKVKMG